MRKELELIAFRLGVHSRGKIIAFLATAGFFTLPHFPAKVVTLAEVTKLRAVSGIRSVSFSRL